MRISKNILIDESIKTKKHNKILDGLKSGKMVMNYHYIIRVRESKGLLELLPSKEIVRLNKLNRAYVVVAVMKDETAGIACIESLVSDLVVKYNRVDASDLDKEFDIQWLS